MELAILVGLPASGKSTFCRERLPGHVVVSRDRMPNVRDRAAREQRLVAAALRAGRDVVVDDTNVSRASRAPLVALGRRLGARVVAYFLPVGAEIALGRNEQRAGRARVPAVAIFAARKRLEPPALAEGFDAVHRVEVPSAA